MKYTAILFDLDNTLLDYTAAQRIATDNNPVLLELVNSPEVQSFESRGVPLPDSAEMKQAFIKAGVHNDPVQFLDTYFNRLSQHGTLIKGAMQTLEELNGKAKLAVVSNGHSSVQLPRMQKAGIVKFFPHLFFSRDIGIAKPDPEILGIAINTLGATPEKTLFIGDSTTSDQPAAKAAGVDFFLFKGDYSDPVLLKLLQ